MKRAVFRLLNARASLLASVEGGGCQSPYEKGSLQMAESNGQNRSRPFQMPIVPCQHAAHFVKLVRALLQNMAFAGIDDHFCFDAEQFEALVPGSPVVDRDTLVRRVDALGIRRIRRLLCISIDLPPERRDESQRLLFRPTRARSETSDSIASWTKRQVRSHETVRRGARHHQRHRNARRCRTRKWESSSLWTGGNGTLTRRGTF